MFHAGEQRDPAVDHLMVAGKHIGTLANTIQGVTRYGILVSELHTGNVKLSIKIEKQLFSGESEYQRIDVFDSEEFGKFISLDGEIVFSEGRVYL